MFLSIKRKIRERIKRFIATLLKEIKKTNEENHLSFIRSFKNVVISDTFICGEGSIVNIEGAGPKCLSIGNHVYTRRYFNIIMASENASLHIGDNVFFNNYCSINCLGTTEIGANTIFGESVKLYDHNHRYHYSEQSLEVMRNEFTTGKIVIGNNCWIGSNVTILSNVTIGENVIIGANCLIYKSVPSNSIVKHKEELLLISN